jgi:UDP-galactopyranose mutase
MNYADADVPYTRSIEFKNFNPERIDVIEQERTIVWDEYSRFANQYDEPYYPVNTDADREMFAQYSKMEKDEPEVVFGGRLGGYAYFDMHQTINSALVAFEKQVRGLLENA